MGGLLSKNHFEVGGKVCDSNPNAIKDLGELILVYRL